jgi:hypothetical protein
MTQHQLTFDHHSGRVNAPKAPLGDEDVVFLEPLVGQRWQDSHIDEGDP